MNQVKIVNRKLHQDCIRKFEADTKTVHTVNRSVMESFDKEGIMFASAEYKKMDAGAPVVTVYRVDADYIERLYL